MVVCQLNFVSILSLPTEDQTPLVIHANAVKPLEVRLLIPVSLKDERKGSITGINRTPNDQQRIIDELAQDLLLCSKWQPLNTFIYMIYNSRDLRDPEALERLDANCEIAGKTYSTHIVLA
jgi:hypothetical protein